MIRRLKQQAALHRLGALACSAVLLAAAAARADQVTSKGTVLHGKITALSPAGITFEPDRRNFFAGEAGGAWVYERYFGGDTNDYFALAFALVAGYYLPYGAHFDGRVDYLPAVDNWTVDYLLRSQAALTMPLVEPISAKLSVLDEYDNTPAPDTDRNSLFIAAGLSLAS